MKLSPQLKESLLNELQFVSKNMKATQNPAEKIFLFSAIYGKAYQIVNIEYDAELNFFHQVLGSAFATLNTNFNQVKSGQLVPTFAPNLFSRIESQIDQLAELIETNKPCYSAIQEIANLAYSTSGNGHFLVLKGVLKV